MKHPNRGIPMRTLWCYVREYLLAKLSAELGQLSAEIRRFIAEGLDALRAGSLRNRALPRTRVATSFADRRFARCTERVRQEHRVVGGEDFVALLSDLHALLI